jgi:hypothetical protein
MSLKGIHTKHRITLLNAVASATLAYSMSSLVYPSNILAALNTWTSNQLKWAMKAPRSASTRFLYLEYGLRELKDLNYTTYLNAHIQRTLNRPEVLSYSTIKQENDSVPLFSHHTLKTGYVNKLLSKGGPIPASLIAYKIGLNVVNLQDSTLSIETSHAKIVPEQFTHLRSLYKELEAQKVTHWHQLADEESKIFTLKELHTKKHFQIKT